MKLSLFFPAILCSFTATAQLKYVVEDFEGIANGQGDLKKNGIFVFGNMQAGVETASTQHKGYSGDRCVVIEKTGNQEYGGWGKGIGFNMELVPETDYLSFYMQQPSSESTTLKIELQEDDNENNVYDQGDDSWVFEKKTEPRKQAEWELVSIPLAAFKDANPGGDGSFNISYKKGKLFCFIVTFQDAKSIKTSRQWAFDFICFSKGKLPVGSTLFDAPAAAGKACALGAWSKEGNTADFTAIAPAFEKYFGSTDKKLGVIHFFQPFATDGGNQQNHYPSVERVNKVVAQGYIPMITLEDHFVKTSPGMKQPNLYSIVEGHFDAFFATWAKEIRQVKGTVLLRILHEFNGDWYPWCIVNNDRNPELLVKAYRHIHDIFTAQGVKNVKFIWCPNSTSFPQEKWNYILDAYPGNEYVDFVGIDIYNGAGQELPAWRSFRKEGIENYFTLRQQFPGKALLVCEASSRERKDFEPSSAQNKAEWIRQMSEALQTDMSDVLLLTWFNEKGTFRIDSSPAATEAFRQYVINSAYFRTGRSWLDIVLGL